MLDQFKNDQPEFYEYIVETIKVNKKISHAYFIESNNYSKTEELVISFVKFLFCKDKETNSCSKCNICNLIDNNTLYDLKIIKPDGLTIKKEQLLDVESSFKTKSENKYRIYVIFEADRLNNVSANAILKFLEEPEPGIIGIFVSQSRYKILNTIISRCQIISLREKNGENTYNIDNNKIIEFLDLLEEKKEKSIAYYNKILDIKKMTRENMLEFFNTMSELFEEIINIKCIPSYKENKYKEISSRLFKISNDNELNSLISKHQTIYEQLDILKANTNLNLTMAKFIIDYSKY